MRARGWHDQADQLLAISNSAAASKATLRPLIKSEFLIRNSISRDQAAEAFFAALGQAPSRAAPTALAAIVFVDIVDSTARVAAAGDSSWKTTIEGFYSISREILDRLGGRIIKTTGDGFLAVLAAPGSALDAAREIVRAGRAAGLSTRTGAHLTEMEIVEDVDIGGLGVVVAARAMAIGGPGEVVVTSTLRDAVAGSGRRFRELGRFELKGVPGTWILSKYIGVAPRKSEKPER
jgi:class 3 adenylate cyclase